MRFHAQSEREEAAITKAEGRVAGFLERIRLACGQRVASVVAVTTLVGAGKFLAEHEGERVAAELLSELAAAAVLKA